MAAKKGNTKVAKRIENPVGEPSEDAQLVAHFKSADALVSMLLNTVEEWNNRDSMVCSMAEGGRRIAELNEDAINEEKLFEAIQGQAGDCGYAGTLRAGLERLKEMAHA